MTIEITGCAASHDDNANVGAARESVQRFGERVAHLRVEVDAFCATKRNHRNSIGCSCRQNLGVHRPPPPLYNVTSKRTFSIEKLLVAPRFFNHLRKHSLAPPGLKRSL